MLDKDKLILLVTINVTNRYHEYFARLATQFDRVLGSKFDDSVNWIIVPSKNSDEIEIKRLNTEYINPEELDQILREAEEIKNQVLASTNRSEP